MKRLSNLEVKQRRLKREGVSDAFSLIIIFLLTGGCHTCAAKYVPPPVCEVFQRDIHSLLIALYECDKRLFDLIRTLWGPQRSS